MSSSATNPSSTSPEEQHAPATEKPPRRPSAQRKRRVDKDAKHPTPTSNEAPREVAPMKRKRMSVACLGCRSRKVKCDGRKPRCFNCELYHDECTFVFHNDKRKPYPKEYIDALTTRISVLEDLLKKANIEFDLEPDLPNIPKPSEDRDESPTINNNEVTDEYMDRLSDRVGQLSMTPSGLRYFGPTSNLHLLSSIVWTKRPAENLEIKGRAAVEALGLSYDVDPVKRDHLLNLYWTWHHPFFNVTEKSIFLRDMHAYYNGMGSQVQYFSPLLLNAMLAAASLLDDTYDDNEQYMTKARLMLHIELEAPRITVIQAAAVLGACEAVGDRDTRGWIYSGMAIRMCVDLGYQLKCDTWIEKNVISAEEAHMRKVTFWGCFLFDRLWSLYMGRPASLRLADVFVARPDEGDARYDDKESWVPYSSPHGDLPAIWTDYTAPSHLTTTKIYLIKLTEMIAEIQEVMYSGSEGIGPAQWSFASKMHVRLASWHTTLPPQLLCSLNSQKPVLSHIVVLHLQYHATLILLHRPFLKMINAGANGARVKRTCREAAENISNLLEKYRVSWYGLRRMSVISLHITFTAATVHLLNAWNENDANKAAAVRGFKICCTALGELGVAYETARRTVAVLTCLASKGRGNTGPVENGWADRPVSAETASIDNMWMPGQSNDYHVASNNTYELAMAQQLPQHALDIPPYQQQHHDSITTLDAVSYNSNNFMTLPTQGIQATMPTDEWFSKNNNYVINEDLNEVVSGFPLDPLVHQSQHSTHSSQPQRILPEASQTQRVAPEKPTSSIAHKDMSELLVLAPGQFVGPQGYPLGPMFNDASEQALPGTSVNSTVGNNGNAEAAVMSTQNWGYVPSIKREPGQEQYYQPKWSN